MANRASIPLSEAGNLVQIPSTTPKTRLASFGSEYFSIFKKARKTAKNEENPRKSRVFRGASILVPKLGCGDGI